MMHRGIRMTRKQAKGPGELPSWISEEEDTSLSMVSKRHGVSRS